MNRQYYVATRRILLAACKRSAPEQRKHAQNAMNTLRQTRGLSKKPMMPPPGYAIRADGLFGCPYYAIIDDDFGFIVSDTFATREKATAAAWEHYNQRNKGDLS